MKDTMLRVSLGIALLVAGYMAGTRSAAPIHAQGMRAAIPLSYGRVVAADSGSLWFEDAGGTLRQVTIPAGTTAYTVSRTR